MMRRTLLAAIAIGIVVMWACLPYGEKVGNFEYKSFGGSFLTSLRQWGEPGPPPRPWGPEDVVALPMARLLSSGAAHADARIAYDPNAQFDLAVSEVELRRNNAGRMMPVICTAMRFHTSVLEARPSAASTAFTRALKSLHERSLPGTLSENAATPKS